MDDAVQSLAQSQSHKDLTAPVDLLMPDHRQMLTNEGLGLHCSPMTINGPRMGMKFSGDQLEWVLPRTVLHNANQLLIDLVVCSCGIKLTFIGSQVFGNFGNLLAKAAGIMDADMQCHLFLLI